jgi:5'-nucleotidase-like protein
VLLHRAGNLEPPGASYRVAMNNFLADGGDGFTVFREGTDQLGGEIDLDALVNYFMKQSPVGPGPGHGRCGSSNTRRDGAGGRSFVAPSGRIPSRMIPR